ncbi:MAG: hypothetical protein RL354_1707, partial [Planctomycetota bacterium]
MQNRAISVLTVLASVAVFAASPSAHAQGADNCVDAGALKGYGSFPFSTVGATTDGAADVL